MRSPKTEDGPEHEVDEFLDQISARVTIATATWSKRLPVIIYARRAGRHGKWRYVSPQVEEILGSPAEEFKRDAGLWARLLPS